METTLKRTVKIYSTSTGLKLIESSAKTWGELQNDLDANNISYSNMNAVENVNNSSLVLIEARLPEGEFVLMLTPQKTKSGSDYKTIRAEVVDAINEHGELAKEHFNSGGRNYTNKTKVELAILLENWKSKTTKTVNIIEQKSVQSQSTDKKVNKMSFVEALRLVLSYDEVSDYGSLESDILDVIEELECNCINETTTINENLSKDELSWINNVKNKL